MGKSIEDDVMEALKGHPLILDIQLDYATTASGMRVRYTLICDCVLTLAYSECVFYISAKDIRNVIDSRIRLHSCQAQVYDWDRADYSNGVMAKSSVSPNYAARAYQAYFGPKQSEPVSDYALFMEYQKTYRTVSLDTQIKMALGELGSMPLVPSLKEALRKEDEEKDRRAREALYSQMYAVPTDDQLEEPESISETERPNELVRRFSGLDFE